MDARPDSEPSSKENVVDSEALVQLAQFGVTQHRLNRRHTRINSTAIQRRHNTTRKYTRCTRARHKRIYFSVPKRRSMAHNIRTCKFICTKEDRLLSVDETDQVYNGSTIGRIWMRGEKVDHRKYTPSCLFLGQFQRMRLREI